MIGIGICYFHIRRISGNSDLGIISLSRLPGSDHIRSLIVLICIFHDLYLCIGRESLYLDACSVFQSDLCLPILKHNRLRRCAFVCCTYRIICSIQRIFFHTSGQRKLKLRLCTFQTGIIDYVLADLKIPGAGISDLYDYSSREQVRQLLIIQFL